MTDLSFSTNVQGWFKLETHDLTGKLTSSTDWFPNLITNGGIERMGNSDDYLSHCQVGRGTNAPLVTNTALQTRVTSSSTYTSEYKVQSVEPYYVSIIRTYTFTAGTITGSISEVGVGWASTGSLFSRSLIKDSNNNTTTITILSDETLTVSYQLRLYPPISDVSGSINIAGTNHNWTARATGVTNSRDFEFSWAIPSSSISRSTISSINSFVKAFDGSISNITSTPNGISSSGSIEAISYTSNSYKRSANLNWDYSQGNLVNGIKSIGFTLGWCSYQIELTPPIMKTSNDRIRFKIEHSWSRKEV